MAGLSLGGWYCPACIAEHSLPLDGTAIGEVDEFLGTDLLHQLAVRDRVAAPQRRPATIL
jgi:hypothetical protein